MNANAILDFEQHGHLGGDFDVLAVRVGEVEEDYFGDGAVAAGIDAEGDADVAVLGIAGGPGFEVVEDSGEGLGGGDGVAGGVAAVKEPLAEGAGADGEGDMAGELGGEGDKGASADGGESVSGLSDAEEGLKGSTHDRDC